MTYGWIHVYVELEIVVIIPKLNMLMSVKICVFKTIITEWISLNVIVISWGIPWLKFFCWQMVMENYFL
jgi:hypothetical protein